MSFLGGIGVFIVCMLVSTSAVARPGPVERFAVVIGNNRGERADTKLRYADDDALATHRLLVEAGATSRLLASFDEDSRRLAGSLAPDGPARVDSLERAVQSLLVAMRKAAARGATTEFLFFYSGHGDVEGGEGFLVLEDGRFTRSKLFELLSRSPAARNHVVIDACKSYFVVFERGPGGRRETYAGAIAAAIPARLANTGFVLSTSSDRDSHEWERYQGGILSHELRSALRGAADADVDGRISYAELGAFLTRSNEAINNPRFRPDFLLRAPGGDLGRPMLDWTRARAPLSFGAKAWGHFYVETARGDRLLDAHPSPGQPLRLWLPDERPLFVRSNDHLGETVVEADAPLEVAALRATTPAVASRGALNLALERLFALPFDGADVQAFRARTTVDERPSAPSEQRPGRSFVRTVSGVTALVGIGAGLTLNGLALGTYLSSSDESQVRTEELNRRTKAFNYAAAGCYAGAAVAAGVWGLASFWPEGSIGVAPSTGKTPLPSGFVLDVRGGF
ncbi:MAG TPA: caspase family protein [Polyangiaceae bacterium]